MDASDATAMYLRLMRTLRKCMMNFGSVTFRTENQTMLLHHRKLGSRSERADGLREFSHYTAVYSTGHGDHIFVLDLLEEVRSMFFRICSYQKCREVQEVFVCVGPLHSHDCSEFQSYLPRASHIC